MRRSLLVAIVCTTVLVPLHLPARDFPLSVEMANPLLTDGGVADFAYHDYTFLSGPVDVFSVRQRTMVSTRPLDSFAIAANWAMYLMVGPVPGGDDAFSIARWVMNTVQFEYGLSAAVSFERFDLVATYGRTSQHPLVGSGFSEVSSDIVEAQMILFPAPGTAVALRVAYVDLFDFWQSPLLAPRTLLRMELPAEALLPVPGSGRLNAFARAWPRLLVLRRSGAWPYADVDPAVQMEFDAEAGIRVDGDASFAELFLELFITRDTEQLRGQPAPLTTFGLGARIGLP